MKLILAGIVLILIVEANANWFTFPYEAGSGARDMVRAHTDARGNADAAQRGEGGRRAAEVISNAREWVQERTGHGSEDSAADQKANEHGRSGGDPNDYRPPGLPAKY
ncbi:serum amyloid A [Anarhichas minor]|uniref:serum amyloid A n=1 Tax=Anarhichas minor TaxID=65739 RepID=UPI003F733CAF